MQGVHSQVESVVGVRLREGEGGGLREDGRGKKASTGEEKKREFPRKLCLRGRVAVIIRNYVRGGGEGGATIIAPVR